MTSIIGTVRAEKWWNGKLAPVLGVATLALVARPASAPATTGDLGRLAAFLGSAIGLAAFGHVINDLADRESDRLAAKPNPLDRTTPLRSVVLVVACLVLGVVPWLTVGATSSTWVYLGIEVALLLAYSLPPARLKVRGVPGALADAAYAYIVPFLWAVSEFSGPAGPPAAFSVVLAVWAGAMGLRGILWHQIEDLASDRRAGDRTAVERLGAVRAERLVDRGLVPAEIVAAITLVAAAHHRVPWLWWFVTAYVGWQLFQVRYLWTEPVFEPGRRARRDRRARVGLVGFTLGNELVERWLPMAATVVLAIADPWWWFAVGLVLIVFESGARDFLRDDVWGLTDAVNRAVYDVWAWLSVPQTVRRFRQRMASGPNATTSAERERRRWVFVVCGSADHLLTLATAVGHLRRLSELEIWVVTDVARNEIPVTDEVDRVIDVVAPAELDHHQASIWMKTSLPDHLPAGEWCYLDSDVLAIRPGAEAIFDLRETPVIFASDLNGSPQSVDHFSPFAMTCDCLTRQTSCHHLRDEIGRRFGLDVPGSWLHWNGGVFVFADGSAPFFEEWHRAAIDSFAWPEWKTRDQGALIATAWKLELQDQPRLPVEFNFIADFGHYGLVHDPAHGWSQYAGGEWADPYLIHLFSSPLDDPKWTFEHDLRKAVLQERRQRYRARGEEIKHNIKMAYGRTISAIRTAIVLTGVGIRRVYWAVRTWRELQMLRLRHTRRRVSRERIAASWRRRRGR